MSTSSEFAKSYTSIGGCDIRATFGHQIIGTLQGISWSVTREKGGIYTMGSEEVRAFARGKRGIAGSLVFIQFDRHALLSEMDSAKFWADKDALYGDSSGKLLSVGGRRTADADAFNQEGSYGTDELNPRSDQQAMTPWYADQIPPFDITLSGATEYGVAAVMRIIGVEILNEGSGASIDDIVLEHQMSFVARAIVPWQPSGFMDPNDQ